MSRSEPEESATTIFFDVPSSLTEPLSEASTPSTFLKNAFGRSSSSSMVYVKVMLPSIADSALLVASYELLSSF